MFYYGNSIQGFLNDETEVILADLRAYGGGPEQDYAWRESLKVMKARIRELFEGSDEPGYIMFEYVVPRLPKRVDVLLLMRGIVFVIEFKVGADRYKLEDTNQVMDYALDLKNFHAESRNMPIVPILVATRATMPTSGQLRKCEDRVFYPIRVNSSAKMCDYIRNACEQEGDASFSQADIDRWLNSAYEPTPTIIEATRALYANHSVKDLVRTGAGAENINRTTNQINTIIDQTKAAGEKAIIFVTGVPGAGKTLVGLNVAAGRPDAQDRAVYLSGNGPLVQVLSNALARDQVARDIAAGRPLNMARALRETHFISGIHNYRDQMLDKLRKPIVGDDIEIDTDRIVANDRAGYGEVENIVIFDEAQRSWTQKKLATWLSRKRQISGFPLSESEFLIWGMNLRNDWAVIICLVGGGQEIHDGEAGIGEWIKAVNERFTDWKVYLSDQLVEKEYASGKVNEMLALNQHTTFYTDLHLSVSMRSFRAEKLSAFVHELLDNQPAQARMLYEQIAANYPIVLTRDIEKAREWVRAQARGSERYGLLVSSKAKGLASYRIICDDRYPDTVAWFLDDAESPKASYNLRDVGTEFQVQGLELDWTCVVWDGDLSYTANGWQPYSVSRQYWKPLTDPEKSDYLLNSYRVLLTRARQGMVICVPEGFGEGLNAPENYDETFDYLCSLGLAHI